MTGGMIWALAAVVAGNAQAAPDVAVPLAPSGKWVVRYAPGNCTLSRDFGTAPDRLATLTLQPTTLGDTVLILATAPKGLAVRPATSSKPRLTMLPAGRDIPIKHERHGPIALVHFDAHLDTWDSMFGASLTHGTPFRRATEEGLLAVDHCAHVGIRQTTPAAQDLADDKKLGFATITTLEVARRGVEEAADRIRERVGALPVYLSIDIDVLDPAHAPATGTPEPGGLTTRELQMLLFSLVGLNIVGADVVEVSPAYDHAQITALAAAGLVFDLLALLARAR